MNQSNQFCGLCGALAVLAERSGIGWASSKRKEPVCTSDSTHYVEHPVTLLVLQNVSNKMLAIRERGLDNNPDLDLARECLDYLMQKAIPDVLNSFLLIQVQ